MGQGGGGVIHIARKNLFTNPPNVLSRKPNGRFLLGKTRR